MTPTERLNELELEPRWPMSDKDKRELGIYFPQAAINSVGGLRDLLREAERHFQGPVKSALEVGCYWGVSSECLALYCDQLTCIDPWEGEYDVFDQFVARMAKYDNVSYHRVPSPEAASLFADESFHLIYLDGMHTYAEVVADINAWLPKVVRGGLLCGHDFVDYRQSWAAQWLQVPQAVRDTIGEPHATFRDSSWLWRKP